MIYVKFDEEALPGLSRLGFYKNEIERLFTKGQQLLLFEL